jgi:hypothetical protein
MRRALLLPLLLAAACARQPPAPTPPAPDVRSSTILVRPPATIRHTRPMIYVVDGVRHTDSSFQALGLAADDIESIELMRCTDVCSDTSVVTIRTRRPANPRP